MAAAVICECCGKPGSTSDMLHIRVHKMASATEFKSKAEDYFDVCKDCYKKIDELLEHKEKHK